jgi:hypothetical protein
MNIQYKEMILKIRKIDDARYTREVYDKQEKLLWSGGLQYYIYEGLEVMNAEKILDLIEQMKKIPSFNIVEVVNDFAN